MNGIMEVIPIKSITEVIVSKPNSQDRERFSFFVNIRKIFLNIDCTVSSADFDCAAKENNPQLRLVMI